MTLVKKYNSPILVTGAAGFIGAKTIELLLAEGNTVVGVDNLNDYYDTRLKYYRINCLLGHSEPQKTISLTNDSDGLEKANFSTEAFTFYKLDIENEHNLSALFKRYSFTSVISNNS